MQEFSGSSPLGSILARIGIKGIRVPFSKALYLVSDEFSVKTSAFRYMTYFGAISSQLYLFGGYLGYLKKVEKSYKQ